MFAGCKQNGHQNTLGAEEQGEEVKARLVMKHVSTWKDENKGFFAVTPTPMSFNLDLSLAARRVALVKSQTITCIDVSTACLHAEMNYEYHIKMDADTHALIR